MTNNILTISVHELKSRLDNDASINIIDVREDHEWQESRIPGALHMPKDQISELIDSQISDRNIPLYLHCRGGVRSLYAANSLRQMGYTEIYSIDGGIMEWEQNGYPVERN
jgi:rhodanese-related sulfurtransferase